MPHDTDLLIGGDVAARFGLSDRLADGAAAPGIPGQPTLDDEGRTLMVDRRRSVD